MAKQQKEQEVVNIKEVTKDTSNNQISKFFKENKDDHYNYEQEFNYKISTGSLIFDSVLGGGGISNGCLRATGGPSNGKSSFILTLAKNFLNTIPNSRVVYARSEGRLSDSVKNRSGIKFVSNPNEFEDNTCLVVDSNVYEFVFGLFREMILNNPQNKKYFFIVDSCDSLCRREDLPKPFEDAHMSPGGAMLTTVFFKKVALAMAKRGHTMAFISQKRDTIKMDMRQKVGDKQGNASGSNALKHQADIVFEFLNRSEFNGDFIRENPSDKNSKIIGHWCNVKIIKGDEKNEITLRYPIKYGCQNNSSVWVAYEICDMLMMWDLVKKAGAGWLTLNEDLRKELEPFDKDIPEKIQGVDNLRKYLEEKPEIMKYLFNKFENIIN